MCLRPLCSDSYPLFVRSFFYFFLRTFLCNVPFRVVSELIAYQHLKRLTSAIPRSSGSPFLRGYKPSISDSLNESVCESAVRSPLLYLEFQIYDMRTVDGRTAAQLLAGRWLRWCLTHFNTLSTSPALSSLLSTLLTLPPSRTYAPLRLSFFNRLIG